MRKRAWRRGAWKLIEALEPDFHGFPPLELYNLADDPGERHNLADERPEVVDELRQRVPRKVAGLGLLYRRMVEESREGELCSAFVTAHWQGAPYVTFGGTPASIRAF